MPLATGFGLLALVVVLSQQAVYLALELLVLGLAGDEALPELFAVHAVEHVVYGGDAHLDPRVALAQQLLCVCSIIKSSSSLDKMNLV